MAYKLSYSSDTQSHPRRRTTRPRPAQRAWGHSGESMTNTDYLILAAVLIGVALLRRRDPLAPWRRYMRAGLVGI